MTLFWICLGASLYGVGWLFIWSLCVMAARSDRFVERPKRVHLTWE